MAASKTKAKGPKHPPKGQTPKHLEPHRFQKGVSGNPGGRPKKFLTLISDALREELKEIDPEQQMTYAELLAKKLVKEAISGTLPISAIKEIADRTEGKPKQQVDVNDVTDKFSGRTKEELAYFAEHGTFPSVQG